MVQLDAAQTENLSTALVVARAWAVASGGDPVAASERVAFCAWTESRGYVYSNNGTNTSHSPGVTPAIAAILRRSLNLRYDRIGSNGRSTGMYQQISADVDGGWGDMSGTMDPAISTARFLARLVVTDNPVYAGLLLTPTGSRRVAITLSSPIAADVLRVQQPLADEAESDNYGAAQVAIAREIVAQLSPDTPATGADVTLEGLADMALTADQTKQLDDYANGITTKVLFYKVNGRQSLADYLEHFKTYIAQAIAPLVSEALTFRILKDGGALYLYGPGTLRHISPSEYAALLDAEIVSKRQKAVSHATIVALSASLAKSNGVVAV